MYNQIMHLIKLASESGKYQEIFRRPLFPKADPTNGWNLMLRFG